MFHQYIDLIQGKLLKGLPGKNAQSLMDPLFNRREELGLELNLNNKKPKDSAVLIFLYPDQTNSKPLSVLMKRPKDEKGKHAGQVSFPGGGFHTSDHDYTVTALREAEEEIGIKKEKVQIIGKLTPLFIPVSNYIVHPFIGYSMEKPSFILKSDEVESIIEFPLDLILNQASKSRINMYLRLANKNVDVPCYIIQDHCVWGATAMMIAELEMLLRRK